LVTEVPTAVHAFGDEHDTPFSSDSASGFGVAWIDHPAPVLALDVPLPKTTTEAKTTPMPTARHVTAPRDPNLANTIS
jgi:hypothetical protein